VECAVKSAGYPPLEWYDVLWAIEREGPLRQRDLAANMLIARYSISRLIDRMEGEGLVERRSCPGDARGQTVHLTAAGRKLRKRIWTAYGPAMKAALGGLSEDECVMLAGLLAKLG
jgi:DNA-binding MarR family transcriptional regulator